MEGKQGDKQDHKRNSRNYSQLDIARKLWFQNVRRYAHINDLLMYKKKNGRNSFISTGN